MPHQVTRGWQKEQDRLRVMEGSGISDVNPDGGIDPKEGLVSTTQPGENDPEKGDSER